MAVQLSFFLYGDNCKPQLLVDKDEKFVNILGLITTGICVPIRANKERDFPLFIIFISSEAPENSPP